MKKLFFASILMLATLTACNNETSNTAPEEQQNQTFSSKTMARGEDLPELTPEEEKAVIEEAARTLMYVRESELKGEEADTGRKALILCHTNLSAMSGHACVYNSSGYLVTVTWSLESEHYDAGNGLWGTYPDHRIIYRGKVTPRCNC